MQKTHPVRICCWLTLRLDNFGASQHWQQVSLKPFLRADARAQLLAELAWINDTVIAEEDANKLVQVLGGLPLAIHLAAGYLAADAGYSVDEFLHELHATGFDLPPEDATDGLYTRDQARAVLHSTFGISLRLLERQTHKRLPQAGKHFSHLGFTPKQGFGLAIAVIMTNLSEPEALFLLRQTAKLGLLEQPHSAEKFWKIHPLLAAWLCQQDPEASAWQRLHEWIYPRLPEPKAAPGEEADYTHWKELSSEPEALAEWLEAVPDNLTSIVAQAGSAYAEKYGPFAHWSAFCQRALLNPALDDEKRADILSTLMKVAQSCGDMDIALQAAEEKMELDTFWGREKCAVVARGVKADILQARGQLDEALRIRTEDQLPVYERLGDVRSIAITKGNIADILQDRGQLDEALRIRQQEELPVYERLGEVRSIAITKGKIATLLWEKDAQTYREQVRELLCDAQQLFRKMQLPEADAVQSWLDSYGLSCTGEDDRKQITQPKPAILHTATYQTRKSTVSIEGINLSGMEACHPFLLRL
jgi:tetratricopeptide (TPR) repeat protein